VTRELGPHSRNVTEPQELASRLAWIATNLISAFGFALKRSVRNWRLLAVSFLGLVAAVGLSAAIPLYSYGALDRLLQTRVESIISMPPGVIRVRSMFYFSKPDDVDQYNRLDELVVNHAQSIVGLPQRRMVRFVASNFFLIWPFRPDGQAERNYQRRMVTFVYQQDLMDHVRIVEGEGLSAGPIAEGEDVPVLISAAASELDVEVGERIALTGFDDASEARPLRVVGIWEPIDPEDLYWPYDPTSYTTQLFVSEEVFKQSLMPRYALFLKEASWYIVFDQTRLSGANASRVLSGLEYLEQQAKLCVSNARVETTLRRSLAIYDRQALVLSTLMSVLSIPTIAMVLYFVGLSMRMVVERQQGEVALLKSRGASTLQAVGIWLSQGLILGAAAMLAGPLFGIGIAQLVGQTVGFMQFASRPMLAVPLNPQVFEMAGAAALIALPATVLPAIAAARRSIVGYRHDAARAIRRPAWQGLPLDVVLLGIAGYGYYMLYQRETILPLDKGESFVIDPLLVLVPALFVFGAALLTLRLYPLITNALARLVALLPGPTVSVSLALRQIARAPGQHAYLVLLLTLAVALGSYSASTAQTIDRNSIERVLYDIPSDLELWEIWIKEAGELHVEQVEGGGVVLTGEFFSEPPAEIYEAPGVIATSPFKLYKVTPGIGRNPKPGNLLALDRLKYPSAAWWRRDFAEKPLGALMNALGANEAATLVSRSFLTSANLRLGDRYTLLFDTTSVEFYVADVVDYFPGLYPEQGPFFVANLDYVYDMVGIEPYRVLVKVEPGAGSADVVEALVERGAAIEFTRDSRATINQSRADPQRTALFGALTIGFVVAIVLVVLGFMLYTFLSYESRIAQLGILRAIGLSTRQLLVVLFSEQMLLIALGVVLGTGIGAITNSLFIPFLQVGTEGQTPRFVVQTAWADLARVYAVLGLMLIAGLAVAGWLVRRLALYQAVKLGEEG
jgi:putative ABC transport system permease protein